VDYGSTPQFTITAYTGYHILDVKVDDVSVLGDMVGGVYTFPAVTADHAIDATFAIDQFTITVTQSAGGTIVPGTSTVDYGSTPSFTITPDTGHHIVSITANGLPVTVTSPKGQVYQFDPVSADGSLSATFAIDQFTITPSAGVGGSISPDTPQTVDYGSTPSFTVTADTGSGYHVLDVRVDDVSVLGDMVGNTYTFPAVSANHAITASFAIDTFTITPSAGVGGSISPDTPQTVDYGSTPSFTITPNTGYHLLDVRVDDVSVLGDLVGGVYTFPAVTANHVITASFAVDTFTITPSAGAHGSISPSTPQTVDYGSTPSFIITPDPDYHVLDVRVGDVSVLGDMVGNTYTFDPVTADHAIAATFAID